MVELVQYHNHDITVDTVKLIEQLHLHKNSSFKKNIFLYMCVCIHTHTHTHTLHLLEQV